MRTSKTFSAFFVVLGLLSSTACFLSKPKPQIPIVPIPAPGPVAAPSPLEEPPDLEASTSPAAIPELPELFAMHLPEVPAPKPIRPPAPKPPAPAPPPPETPTVTPQVPQLIPLLSQAERNRRNQEIADFMRRAEAALTQIGNRRLTTRQLTDKTRAETFLRQARETRSVDLVTASNLAQRAALLAESLVSTLR